MVRIYVEMSTKDWDLAGLTDPDGNLGKPVPSGYVVVPGKIELEGDAIRWELAGPARRQEISRSMLNEFVRLWEQDNAAILRFARKWGVLVLRETKGQQSTLYSPCGEAQPEGLEPIAAWKYYSRRAHAVLNIAAALRQGKLGDLSDWRVIAIVEGEPDSAKKSFAEHRYGLPIGLVPEDRPTRRAVDSARTVIAGEADSWLSFWRARRMRGLSDFGVEWNSRSGRWELCVDYHGFLFAAIALQLALSLAGVESLYTCSGCGAPYVREIKRPKPGTANYCPKCSHKGIAQRRAVDAYREKKAEAMRLDDMGTPVDEIARKLSAPLSRIEKWLGKEHPMGKKQRKRVK